MRDAVGAGIRNPHYGATRDDLPFYQRYAAEAVSLAGSTGIPEGFALTGLTGAEPSRSFGRIPGVGTFAGGDAARTPKLSLAIDITLKNPAGDTIGKSQGVVGDKNYSVGSNEEMANALYHLRNG